MKRRLAGTGAVGALALVASTLVMSGCATIPTSGPVSQGAPVRTEQEDPFIRVLARPPRAGATPEQVIYGFLEASASFDRDHEVAREYLAPEKRQAWNPDAGTVVYDSTGSTQLTQEGEGRLVLTAPKAAEISDRGDYTPTGAGTTARAEFVLRKVNNEWRIADLPQGLFLTQFDVDRAFRTFDLYFLDPTKSGLVPNQVLMPVTRTGVATSLLRSLLGGPTPWLAPAVITAFPANTQLTVDSAPIADGVVQVDLSTAVLSASPDDRKALSAQLVWTLRQLPEVTGVRITVQSVPLQVPGVGVVQSRTAWSSYDPDGLPVGAPGYLVRGDRLLELQRTDVGPVSGPFGDGRTPVLSPAVSPEGDQIAGLFPDRKTLLVGAANDKSLPVPRLTGENLSPPSWDAFGNVWAVDRRGSGSVVWAVHVGGKAVQVSANDLSTLQVSSLRLSRDGARAAVIVNNGGQGRLSLARVERRTDGSITLGALRPVESSLVEVKDVAWNDADHLAVLGRDAQGVLQPYLVDPGGTAVRVAGTLPGLATIAAAPGRPLMVGTDDGKVYQDSDSGWREVGPGRDPIYPG